MGRMSDPDSGGSSFSMVLGRWSALRHGDGVAAWGWGCGMGMGLRHGNGVAAWGWGCGMGMGSRHGDGIGSGWDGIELRWAEYKWCEVVAVCKW